MLTFSSRYIILLFLDASSDTIHLRDTHIESDIVILGQGHEIVEVGQGQEIGGADQGRGIVEVGQGHETTVVDLDLGAVEVDLHTANDQDLEKNNVLNILCTAEVAVNIQVPGSISTGCFFCCRIGNSTRGFSPCVSVCVRSTKSVEN